MAGMEKPENKRGRGKSLDQVCLSRVAHVNLFLAGCLSISSNWPFDIVGSSLGTLAFSFCHNG